jgi:hypothetical protein
MACMPVPFHADHDCLNRIGKVGGGGHIYNLFDEEKLKGAIFGLGRESHKKHLLIGRRIQIKIRKGQDQ